MTRASRKGQEFVDDMIRKAALPPGREQHWKGAMANTISADFSFVNTLEEVIEAMDKVGRFEYSGHSKEIVVKAWEEMRSDNSTDALVLER
jgi:hypothetical protein